MKKRTIREARKEAIEFVARAEDLLKHDETPDDMWLIGTKRTSALRRASMELTRALAAMRKFP